MSTKNWSEKVENVLTQRGKNRASLLPCLEVVQDACGYIPHEAVAYLRDAFDITSVDVYGAISFYGMLTTVEQGKNVIRLCDSLPCHINCSEDILEVLQTELAITAGETTPDKKFTLETVACLGMCDQAPAMMINDRNYGNLTADEVRQIIADLR